MLKKIFGATIIVVLFLSLIPLSLCSFEYSTFEDWQLESDHGYVSRLGDALRLWTDDTGNDLAVTIFKEYPPTDDFTFSAEVNAAQLQACGLCVRGSLPAAGSFDGFNLEFGYYGMGNFHLSRNFTDWTSILLGYGEPNVWYTMKLTVHRSPFLIDAAILDENGTQIGAISTPDIYDFNFEDIKYIGISVWGRSADYTFRNIHDPTVCQPQPSAFDDWQVENINSTFTQSSDVLNFSSPGGGSYPLIDYPSLFFYRHYKPTGNFTFSLQVNADSLESCCLALRRNLPIIGVNDGVIFEFGQHTSEVFLMSRNFSGWQTNEIAKGQEHVWYTMVMSVSQAPCLITESVYDENNVCLGSYSTSDLDFKFEDIEYLAFGIWGYQPCSCSFRNVLVSTDNHKTSSISIFAQCTPKIGSTVDITGALTDSAGVPLQNRTIILSYTFPGLNSWVPISSCQTDTQGKYSFQWINSASGTFTLKTQWSGDSTCTGASNTTTLSFLTAENQQAFVFESNSTITALAFNNETSTLTFNVTGPSGTTGFVRATIAKSLLADGEKLQTFLDGKQLEYTLTATDDSWVYYFSYSHSTHQISMHLTSDSQTQPLGNELILVAIVAVLGFVLAVMVLSFSRRNKQKT